MKTVPGERFPDQGVPFHNIEKNWASFYFPTPLRFLRTVYQFRGGAKKFKVRGLEQWRGGNVFSGVIKSIVAPYLYIAFI